MLKDVIHSGPKDEVKNLYNKYYTRLKDHIPTYMYIGKYRRGTIYDVIINHVSQYNYELQVIWKPFKPPLDIFHDVL